MSLIFNEASPNDFALAFKIFDVNGDGALDKEEFQKVQQLIMSQTTVGQRHRDHITPNSSFRVESNSSLEAYFFGKDGQKKLSARKFLEFQEKLHNDILYMEFNRRDESDGVDGIISEESFGQLLLMHAQINEKRQKHMLRRIRKEFKGGPGVTFEETHSFFEFLYHIEDVDMALYFHRMAGLSVDAQLLKRVAEKVIGIEISNHVIDIVITLFDENMVRLYVFFRQAVINLKLGTDEGSSCHRGFLTNAVVRLDGCIVAPACRWQWMMSNSLQWPSNRNSTSTYPLDEELAHLESAVNLIMKKNNDYNKV
uniref:EF-hand domain-containing protein n=1 Tax=Heterorhabditis bacteriophora TaxID=37862 RepID=A0A1I7WMH8_HETBA